MDFHRRAHPAGWYRTESKAGVVCVDSGGRSRFTLFFLVTQQHFESNPSGYVFLLKLPLPEEFETQVQEGLYPGIPWRNPDYHSKASHTHFMISQCI